MPGACKGVAPVCISTLGIRLFGFGYPLGERNIQIGIVRGVVTRCVFGVRRRLELFGMQNDAQKTKDRFL